MNVNLLIDSVVRQTMVLVAQLATSAGARATLAHTANQVFNDLVRELKDQRLGNKVIADMFGLSLRTYHNRIARLTESRTERGRSLWEALLSFVTDRDVVTRAELLDHFSGDDEATVRGVMSDLVSTGMVFKTGRGDQTTYRAARAEEVRRANGDDESARIASFLWVAINRYGPATAEELAGHVPAAGDGLTAALEKLVGDGSIVADESDPPRYTCDECVIPHGDTAGWEAAVFDHYQAMVTAIVTKLRFGTSRSRRDEWVGGSTYGFDVWDGHPLRDEVLTFLGATRERAVALRRRVEQHNADHPSPNGSATRVIAYVGQTVVGLDEDSEEEE